MTKEEFLESNYQVGDLIGISFAEKETTRKIKWFYVTEFYRDGDDENDAYCFHSLQELKEKIESLSSYRNMGIFITEPKNGYIQFSTHHLFHVEQENEIIIC